MQQNINISSARFNGLCFDGGKWRPCKQVLNLDKVKSRDSASVKGASVVLRPVQIGSFASGVIRTFYHRCDTP